VGGCQRGGRSRGNSTAVPSRAPGGRTAGTSDRSRTSSSPEIGVGSRQMASRGWRRHATGQQGSPSRVEPDLMALARYDEIRDQTNSPVIQPCLGRTPVLPIVGVRAMTAATELRRHANQVLSEELRGARIAVIPGDRLPPMNPQVSDVEQSHRRKTGPRSTERDHSTVRSWSTVSAAASKARPPVGGVLGTEDRGGEEREDRRVEALFVQVGVRPVVAGDVLGALGRAPVGVLRGATTVVPHMRSPQIPR
jgi:hypothetical protein